MLRFSETDGALTFSLRVVPRASKTAAAGEHDGALKVRVAVPPVEGAANEELVRFLAHALGVPVRAVEILGGHTSKLKRLRVRGAQSARLISLAGGTQE